MYFSLENPKGKDEKKFVKALKRLACSAQMSPTLPTLKNHECRRILFFFLDIFSLILWL